MDELHHKPRLNSHKPGFFCNFFASLKGINRTNWMWKKTNLPKSCFENWILKVKQTSHRLVSYLFFFSSFLILEKNHSMYELGLRGHIKEVVLE